MAANLVRAGHSVSVFDLSKEAVATLVTVGATAAQSAKEAVTGAQFVISMLPAGAHVEGLYLSGDDPLFDHLAEDALVIDSSTIDAKTAQKVAAIAQERGINLSMHLSLAV